jgi:hypothetical protein
MMIGEYLDGLAVEKAMAFFLAVFLLAAAVGAVVERMRGRNGNLSSDDRRGRIFRGEGGLGAGGAGEDGRGADLAKGGRVALAVASRGRGSQTDTKVEEVKRWISIKR